MATVRKTTAPRKPQRSRTTPIWATSTARPNCSMAPAISYGEGERRATVVGYKDLS